MRFSAFAISVAILFPGCATNIKGIGYVNDAQIRNSLYNLTPKGTSPEEVLIILSKRQKSNEEALKYHKESRQISVYLGEYFSIPFRDDVDAIWQFSKDRKLEEIYLGHSSVAL